VKKIGEIPPYLFEDFLVISIKKEWINVWEKIPNFLVYADGKKLVIKADIRENTDDS